jgi:molybdate transport system substrate-binding protein
VRVSIRVAEVLVAGLLGGIIVAAAPTKAPPESSVLIFAASSVQTVLDRLTPEMERQSSARVRVSYAASSSLAQQIVNGAPAGIFISADLDWMTYLADRHLIKTASRVNLVGNTLVLIAPADEPVALLIAPGFGLGRALGNGRLAIADPASVPAGKYARSALTSLGVWDAVSNKLAAAENVRAALLFVSRGEAPLGIVYRTDALADRGVVIVDTFPPSSHPPIVYPAALTMAASAADARVLAFLTSPQSRAAFRQYGFTVE